MHEAQTSGQVGQGHLATPLVTVCAWPPGWSWYVPGHPAGHSMCLKNMPRTIPMQGLMRKRELAALL